MGMDVTPSAFTRDDRARYRRKVRRCLDVFALMLNKPVLSISYHHKDDALMAEVGLSEYCQDIDHLDIDRLIGQLCKLDRNAQIFAPQIREKTEAYRRALDEQYAQIFNSV